MTLLAFERVSQVTTAAIDFGRDLELLYELAKDRGLHTDPHIRDELAWCYSRVQIMRYQGYRGLTLLLDGQSLTEGVADATGTFTHTFAVGKKTGIRTLEAVGQIAARNGEVTFEVEKTVIG